MASFVSTTFNPSQSQQYKYKGPGGQTQGGGIRQPEMEEGLAREMARMKMEREKQ